MVDSRLLCIGSDENGYKTQGGSGSCDGYNGAQEAGSYFEIVNSPKNYYYPFEGLRTMDDAVHLCASYGGPGTPFGHDDDNTNTEGSLSSQLLLYTRLLTRAS